MLFAGSGIAAPLGSVGAGFEEEHAVVRHYTAAPASTANETDEEVAGKSTGCLSCHTASDRPTMHASDAVNLGCANCHGGDASVSLKPGLVRGTPEYSKV